MIKFFRKIRQKMLTENKFSKYLIYAIGEIILVVIGILIALQINNWNEERKENAIIETYLKSMLVDLKNDIIRFDGIIESMDGQIKTNSSIFLNKAYQKKPMDSIVLIITSYFNDYKIIDQTFQKIKNSGLANQLGSKELNDAINKYYTVDLYKFNLFIDYDEKGSSEDDKFWFLTEEYEINPPHGGGEKLILPFTESEETRKLAFIRKIESNLGRNKLRNNITRKSLGITITKDLKNKAEILAELIIKELNKK
ncbi:DUF6090 family protein [Meishania litoralis]